MGHYWLEMHLKYIHTLSLKPQKHGQSWSTGFEELRIYKSRGLSSTSTHRNY